MMVDAMEFVAVKSYKAKGKRLTTYAIESVAEIEPREVDDVDDEVSPGFSVPSRVSPAASRITHLSGLNFIACMRS